MRPRRPFNLDDKAFCPRRPSQAATQLTLVVWDAGYLRLGRRNIKAETRLMLVRQDADTDFAGGHGLVDLAPAVGFFLENALFFLPGLGLFQLLKGRR